MNAETDESAGTIPGSEPGSEGPVGRPDEPTPIAPDEPIPSGPDPHEPETSGLEPQQETRDERSQEETRD